jgi:hypothetical protein
MVQKALSDSRELDLRALYYKPEWSAFLQYLAHSYRQIGNAEKFVSEIEQVMRGTLGFQSLRKTNPDWANRLIVSVLAYSENLSGKPLSLVDSTGFSWESVSSTLAKISGEKIKPEIWDGEKLFVPGNNNLRKLMGILLSVPELKENLKAATGGRGPDGDFLARLVSSWVNGASIPEMAKEFFSVDANGVAIDDTTAMTNCCRNVFGKLIQTASWGLSALQSLNLGDALDKMPEKERETVRNLPARIYYGVNTNEAIALRILGIPRGAAQQLADKMGKKVTSTPLSQLRTEITESGPKPWVEAMKEKGEDYFKVWRIIEGLN